MQYTGGCRFCGQVHYVTGGEGLTDNQITHLATMACNCDEAQAYQKAEQKKTYTEANVKELFSNDGETVLKGLLGMVDGLARMNIIKVSVTTANGIRASMTAKEKSIKVERTEIDKKSLEG